MIKKDDLQHVQSAFAPYHCKIIPHDFWRTMDIYILDDSEDEIVIFTQIETVPLKNVDRRQTLINTIKKAVRDKGGAIP